MRQPSYSGILWLVLIMALAMSCSHSYQTTSPDGSLKLTVNIKDGKASYAVAKDSRQVIVNSALGFVLANDDNFNSNFKVTGVLKETHDDTWEQPWGEDQYVRNNYNELKLCLQEKDGLKRRMDIVFRLFDDGLGFRYEIPGQENIKDFIVMDETTEFNMPFNNKAWWIPAYRPNRYEYLYSHTLLSKMDTVHTPLTIKTRDGLFLTIHEAALYDYGSMTIARRDTSILKCDITPLSDGTKAHLKTPFNTPWRTVIVAREPAKLIESRMMLNLNEPSKIADMSWIKPTKFMGIWWGMFTDVFTWSQGPKHGATTKNAIKYIDYCAQLHIPALLIEGWNYGWDGDWVANGRGFLYTKPYPDFDIKKICDYAKSKGVNIIGHHETGGATINYENQLDSAFAFYENLGIHYVKTGYVNSKMDGKEFHHSQYGVLHYQKVAETAAMYHIMIDAHEPIKGTGIQRTWPNFMSREGARGQEYESLTNGNPPEHEAVLPFTRLLAGGMDFTPGMFFIENPKKHVSSTLAKQLSYYVVIYSPIEMAADLPEHYLNQPAFKFIQDVPCDWARTIGINAVIGDYVTIARKDRNSDDWYLGSLTDENSRDLKVPLTFLDKGRQYRAEIYADGKDADWQKNQLSIDISSREVTSDTTLDIHLAPGGGYAVRFVAL
ncbi:MAG TPA: glycoside hydrolase family 97 protein [Bacteroidales bacterium]|nr:glycoside hydrolase family 97 protein [Bacteroidales bacterium]